LFTNIEVTHRHSRVHNHQPQPDIWRR